MFLNRIDHDMILRWMRGWLNFLRRVNIHIVLSGPWIIEN